jgi:hypothetical protein
MSCAGRRWFEKREGERGEAQVTLTEKGTPR